MSRPAYGSSEVRVGVLFDLRLSVFWGSVESLFVDRNFIVCVLMESVFLKNRMGKLRFLLTTLPNTFKVSPLPLQYSFRKVLWTTRL
jgi:hypothetical protein